MNIELLLVPNCPHEQSAVRLLRKALDAAGMPGVEFRTITVADPEAAEHLGFTGSPTFEVDGIDLFHDPTRSPGLACRLYRHEAGVAGVPDLEDLRRALLAVRHR